MHCQTLTRGMCNLCGYTKKMSSGYCRLLSYDVKRNTKIDGMGTFKKNINFKVYPYLEYGFILILKSVWNPLDIRLTKHIF